MNTCNQCKKESCTLFRMHDRFHICPDCRSKNMQKAAESRLKKYTDAFGTCPWCGTKWDAALDTCGNQDNTCPECEQGRRWMLKIIRRTDRLAKYVGRVEVREKEGRDARNEPAKKEQQASLPLTAASPSPDLAKRIEGLESLIKKLTSALGGV